MAGVTPCGGSKAVWFDAHLGQLCAGDPTAVGNDAFGVAPRRVKRACGEGAAKVDVDLMKCTAGVVEFIHEAGGTDRDFEACFLGHFTD